MATKKTGKRGTRPPSTQAKRVRGIVSENLAALIDRDYPERKYRTKSLRQKKVASDAGVSWSSIQRQLNPETGKNIDTIVDLAVAFGLRPHELLNPDLLEQLLEQAAQAKLALISNKKAAP